MIASATESDRVRRGSLIVVSGPSGVGKGTVIRTLLGGADPLAGIVKCITATTRRPRPGEQDGIHYHFFTRDEFEERISKGYFLEFASYNGELYGTPIENVERERGLGHDVLLEIEVQGGLNVRKLDPEAVLVFLTPPSWDALEDRLRGRATESPAAVERRLAIARTEMLAAEQYDVRIVNDDVELAAAALRKIIVGRRRT